MTAPPKHSEGFPPMSQAKEMICILTSGQNFVSFLGCPYQFVRTKKMIQS